MAEVTVDEMYADLAAADAAGDTELANAIADQIRAGKYLAARRADVAPRQAHQRSLPGKFAQGASDAPMRALESLKQLGVSIGELAGMVDPGTTAEQTGEMNLRRLIKTGGDPVVEDAADTAETMALMMPGFGASMLPSKGAATFTGAVARHGGLAALEGAALLPASETAQDPVDVLAERGTAGLLGLGIVTPVAGLAAARPAIHNLLVRMKQNTIPNKEHQKLVTRLGGWLKGEKTVAQQTGSEAAKQFESQARLTTSANFLNKQIEQMASRWDALTRYVGRGRKPGEETSFLTTAYRVSKAWESSWKASQAAASKVYGDSMNLALATAAKDKEFFAVPFNSLAKTTDEIAGNTGGRDWWRSLYPGAERPSAAITELDDYLKAIKADPSFSAKMDVGEIVRLRRNLNQMDADFYEAVRSQGPNVDSDLLARHHVLRKVIRALDADVGAFTAAAPAGRPAADALKMLAKANEDYSKFKDTQDFMARTATGQIFGGFSPADAQKFLTDVSKMEPVQQTVLMNTLRAADPGAIPHLRRGILEGAMARARQMGGRPASQGPIDLNILARELEGDMGTIGSQIFSPAQRKEIERGLAAIRVFNESPRTVSINRVLSMESGSMAAGSLAVPFLVRAAWRTMGAASMERLLFSKAGLQSLDVMADTARTASTGGKPKYSAPQIARAMAFMINAGVVAGEPEEIQWIEDNGG